MEVKSCCCLSREIHAFVMHRRAFSSMGDAKRSIFKCRKDSVSRFHDFLDWGKDQKMRVWFLLKLLLIIFWSLWMNVLYGQEGRMGRSCEVVAKPQRRLCLALEFPLDVTVVSFSLMAPQCDVFYQTDLKKKKKGMKELDK